MSEDPTPRHPDKLDRLITLVESLVVRVENIETSMGEIETTLGQVNNRLSTLEDRFSPTNPLPKILAEVQATRADIREFKDEFVSHRLETRSEIRDLKRAYLKIEEWIDQAEAKSK